MQVGAGRDVVLIHGAMTALEDMLIALGPALAPDFRVTAFDRPGHGASGRYGPTGSSWRQAEAIHAVAVDLGLIRPVIVGHSFGGAVALAYGMQFPEDVAGIVAIAPIAFPEVRLEHLLFAPRAGPAGKLLNAALGFTSDPALLSLLWRAMFKPQEMPPAFRDHFPFEIAGRRAQVEAEGEDAALLLTGLAQSALNYWRCPAPVRILGGDQDLVVNNWRHGARAARLLPLGEFELLKGLGHMAHHFAQEEVMAAVRALADACLTEQPGYPR